MEILPELYPLTGLQIGDIQAYVSRAFLYFAAGSNTVFILVDNRPWMMNNYSRSAQLWQLMVTKYRVSPFTNTRALQKASNANETKNENDVNHAPNHAKSKRFNRWFPAIDSTKWQEKYLLPAMDLSKALHGFIVFEVIWKDVHGINYLNELQTDTYLALEVKSMTKWEFYSPEQASSCMSSWFSGKASETQSLKKNLRLLSNLDLHQWNAHSSSVLHQRSSPSEVMSDEEFLDVPESPTGIEDEEEFSEKQVYEFDHISVEETDVSASQYSDTLILFRFVDCLLPEKFRQIIMSDLRLLTLLEAGLPSWVIFFQSYPLFCHFYRPWMRHIARSLYILISLVTVIIGFYDLYKNVPLLKATVAHLSGPLFSWIEGWDMVTRIGYIGTMLFLQNMEKGLKWFMIMSRTTRTLLSAIITPLSRPLSEVIEVISPLWNACAEWNETFFSTVWFAFGAIYNMFLEVVEFVLWPFELFYSYLWIIVMSVRDFVLVPIRCVFMVADYMLIFLYNAFEMIKDVWESVSSIFQVTALTEPGRSAYDISIWQGLWRDLFSKIFQATRSVINGMSAFFMTCNRHRLSTYNHVRAFIRRAALLARITPRACRCQRAPESEQEHEEDVMECDRCK